MIPTRQLAVLKSVPQQSGRSGLGECVNNVVVTVDVEVKVLELVLVMWTVLGVVVSVVVGFTVTGPRGLMVLLSVNVYVFVEVVDTLLVNVVVVVGVAVTVVGVTPDNVKVLRKLHCCSLPPGSIMR